MRARSVMAVAVLLTAFGCGGGGGGDGGDDGGGGNNPPPQQGFVISRDLANSVYTYSIGSAFVSVGLEETSGLVLGIIDYAGSDGGLAFFGQPTSNTSFSIVTAAIDLDDDGDYLEELALDVNPGGRGDFLSGGETLSLDFTVTLSGTRFNNSGGLVRTSATSSLAMDSAKALARTLIE